MLLYHVIINIVGDVGLKPGYHHYSSMASAGLYDCIVHMNLSLN